MSVTRAALPVDDVLPELLSALNSQLCAVLKAPPGAGKTTRVPPALLDAGLAKHGQIVMLEPRRIAARTAARRIAAERGERVGQTAGFRVRFEEATSAATRMLAVTDGILLRRIQEDPFLEGIDVVIFDEFHERRLDSDLALAMVRRVQQTVRPELKLVVMSATLDPGPIADYLGQCPTVESEGRLYPVHIDYLRRPDQRPMSALAASGVEQVLEKTDGDVLVFLPGVGEIMKTLQELEPIARRQQLLVLPLFGDMSAEDQDRVLQPCGQRKVVLSTNVAETSVTIPGITAVVDTGYARQMLFDTDVGLDRLELTAISRAAADQRAGRAGRTQPGLCLRLWQNSAHRLRPETESAELHRVDLSSAVLRLRAWGEKDVLAFPWFETPPTASIEHAEKLLQLLGALDHQGVTPIGRALVRFPAPPRIARLLIESQRLGHGSRGALLAAMLSERDPFVRHSQSPGRSADPQRGPRTTISHRSASDVLDQLSAFEQYLKSGHADTACGTIHPGAAATIRRAARQLELTLAETVRLPGCLLNQPAEAVDHDGGSDESLMRALVCAFPDRVARRRDTGSDKGIMVGGRGVRLAPRSAVRHCPLFLCVDVDGRGTDALVRKASEVRHEWLPPESLRTAEELFFHPGQKQVVARRRTWFDDLMLDETPASISNMQEAAEVLFRNAVLHRRTVLPESDSDVSRFITRVRCLAEWMPELGLPKFDDAAIDDVLKELCMGRRSFVELRQAPWLQTVQSRIEPSLRQMVEREAPEKLQLPNGHRAQLVYEQGRPPVLPVRIQDAFGWKQTPRIAAGRVPVLLHLLAPNMRPQQITDDLASFWAGAYADVRKELKRRYPKHAWPEDPTAPERR